MRVEANQHPQTSPSRVEPELRDLEHAGTSATAPRANSGKPATQRVSLGYTLLTYIFRLLILGIGIAAITGTVLAILQPDKQANQLPKPGSEPATDSPSPTVEQTRLAASAVDLKLQPDQEMVTLEQQISALAAAESGLTPGMFFLNLDTGAYLDLSGNASFPAASTIKIPVLVAFFQDVDAGKIHLDEPLVMRPDLIASEAGVMQYQKPGTKFSALETVSNMITISDNTATNMLIDRLGGAALLNQRFKSWGLTNTAIHNPLPDLKGTNTVSPRDLATLMMLVSQGKLVTLRSRDRLLDIMRHSTINTLLPPGLGEGATIAHKTGDIGFVIGDAGLIDMPNGQRYVAAVMVKRPYNDLRARILIQQISRLTYQAFSQPLLKTSSEMPVSQASNPDDLASP
jgi:beta-lactamase class A